MGGLGLKGKAGAKGKIGLGIKGKTGLKAKLHVKHKINLKGNFGFHGKAKGKIGAGAHFKIKTKKIILKYKIKAGYEGKKSPKEFLLNTSCKASFDKAYQTLYTVNHNRKLTQFLGKKCFRALVRIRGELSCAACDNTKEKFFNDAKKLVIKAEDVNSLGACVDFMAQFTTYKGLLGDMLAFAKVMGTNTDAMQKKLDDMKWDVETDCTKGTTPAPVKKDDKKPAAPAKKDDKKPAPPAKKERILQAPVKKPEPKKDDKKPAAPAKKDDKKPAPPAKKDDKKPATP